MLTNIYFLFRFLLPYERHLKGEEYKPTSASIKRTKSNSGSGSDVETSESTSCSGNSTPIPQLTVIPIPPIPTMSENKVSLAVILIILHHTDI